MPTDYCRLRVTFSKQGRIKYSSHLDLARAWERSLRRARVALAYSQGFNPRPKLQLAAALPLGHTGGAELLDMWLEAEMAVSDFVTALPPVLPDGLTIGRVRRVSLEEPALQTRVEAAEYRVSVEWGEPAGEVALRIERVLAARELPWERRGRRRDLRPLIEGLWLDGMEKNQVVLGMRLAARAGATGRPEPVLGALGMEQAFARYHRRRLILAPWTEEAAQGASSHEP